MQHSQKSLKRKDFSVPSVTEILNTKKAELSVTSALGALGAEVTEFLRAGTGQL